MSADRGDAIRLGPFLVRAGKNEVEAFRGETGALGAVPFTFPVRWLADPHVRAAAIEMLGETWVPIHESQTFDYVVPLERDTDYRLTLEMSREIAPPRLILRAEVARQTGERCLDMEMVLRIIDLSGNGRGAPEP
ncbi:MAG TPA: hypothetical protein VKV77_10430 [Methylovirgula sp.]|nr:hypothetical protein [Methylovirgula sp.]